MKRNLPIYLKDDSGVSAVEFALIAPVLLFMCIGMIDYGLFIHEKMRVENMAQASSDYMIGGGQEDDLTSDIVEAYGSSTGEPTREGGGGTSEYRISAEMQCDCSNGAANDCGPVNECAINEEGGYRRRYYEVTVSKEYNTLVPYLVIPSSMTLTGTARIQID